MDFFSGGFTAASVIVATGGLKSSNVRDGDKTAAAAAELSLSVIDGSKLTLPAAAVLVSVMAAEFPLAPIGCDVKSVSFSANCGEVSFSATGINSADVALPLFVGIDSTIGGEVTQTPACGLNSADGGEFPIVSVAGINSAFDGEVPRGTAAGLNSAIDGAVPIGTTAGLNSTVDGEAPITTAGLSSAGDPLEAA